VSHENEQLKFELFERELLDPLGGLELTETERYVAGVLLNATSQNPMTISQIIGRLDSIWPGKLTSQREVKDLVRGLRRKHGLPILARRRKPAGYWWCGSVAEMEEFILSFRKQALDELGTLGRIVRQNYPALVGQLELRDVESKG